MKKLILVLIALLLIGCSKQIIKTENKKYDEIVNKIIKTTKYDQEYPFDIDAIVYKRKEGYEYSVIIDNFKSTLKNVEVLIYDAAIKDGVYANIGIYDGELTTIPKNETQQPNQTKGIILNQESATQTIRCIVYIAYVENNVRYEKMIEINR